MTTTGNVPSVPLGERTPQRYGKFYNALITVGSMNADGELDSSNSPVGPLLNGHDPALTGTSGSYTTTVEWDAAAMRQVEESEAIRILKGLHYSVSDRILTDYR